MKCVFCYPKGGGGCLNPLTPPPPPPVGYAPDVPLHFAKISLRATYAGFFFKGDDLHFDAADRDTFSFLKRKEEKKKQTEKVCQFSGSQSRGIRVSLYMTDLSDKQAS